MSSEWVEPYLLWAETKAFKRKVDSAKDVILRAANLGRVGFSVSWGKDSTALVGLGYEALGNDCYAFHLASPYRLPGWEIPEEWFLNRLDDRYLSLPYPSSLEEFVSYLQCQGLPHEVSGHHGRAADTKRELGDEACALLGCSVRCLGIRADENAIRKLSSRVHGLIRTGDRPTAWPSAWWTARDVWAFIVSRDLPYHPMYDCETHGFTRETLRNGGWLTTNDPGRLPWLRRHYPAQYEQLVEAFPRLREYGG